jgi:hypothetical protein
MKRADAEPNLHVRIIRHSVEQLQQIAALNLLKSLWVRFGARHNFGEFCVGKLLVVKQVKESIGDAVNLGLLAPAGRHLFW